jgi:hypothetical protein
MFRPGLTALLLFPLACCNPGDPGDTAGSTGGATNNATTGTTGTPGTSSSTSNDPDPTDGGSGSATSGTSTSTSTTTTSTTDATTIGTVTNLTSGSSGGSASSTGPGTTGDTGGPVGCEPATADYGDCATPLGWAFDGTECRPVSGCDCAPDCDKFFQNPAECALTCAAAGHCNEDRLDGAALAQEPVMQGHLCDEIDVCPDSPDLKTIFEEIFGMLICEGGGFPCQGGEKCTGIFQNMLGPEEWLKTCAASLVQGSGDVICVVFGP